MKINNKGFTMIELVLSFSLLSIIVIGMLSIVLNYRSSVKVSNRKLDLVQYKNTVTKVIQEDFKKRGVQNITHCSDSNGTPINACILITFRDSTTKNLSFSNSNVHNRYIQYGNQKFPIDEVVNMENASLSDAIIHLPSERSGINLRTTSVGDKKVFRILIPISADDIDEDFGIFIVTTNDPSVS